MVRKKRVLLISCSVILLCMTIIVGMTYSLFTDRVSIKNHLHAGRLDVALVRTDLEYSVLDADGYLKTVKVERDVDFSEGNDENVFGIDAKDLKIVPGSYFDADMEIRNNGNVAFEYNVGIKLLGDPNALAEQLRVTVTHPDGSTTEKMLSEMAGGIVIATGSMSGSDARQEFGVKVEFVDDIIYNQSVSDTDPLMDNDEAQGKSAVFDLIVTAIQATS